jgi:hypothetical protein
MILSILYEFFVLAAELIGFKYAAEISAPAPESTSQGLLLRVMTLRGILWSEE